MSWSRSSSLGDQSETPKHMGEMQLIFGVKETPPPPPLTPSPMPGVEDGFLILSFPASLPTYFCSSTYPLFTLPQEGSSYHQKWRWLGAQCPGCLKYQSVFKEDPERSLLFPPAFWICIVSRPRQVSLSPAYVSSPFSLNLSLSSFPLSSTEHTIGNIRFRGKRVMSLV